MFYELKSVLTRDGFTSIILTLNLQHNNNPPRSSCEPRRILCFYATGRVISMPLRNWFPMRYLRLRGLPMLSSTKIWLTSTCFLESYFFKWRMPAAFVRGQCGCLWERGRPARGLPRMHVLGLYLNHREKEIRSFFHKEVVASDGERRVSKRLLSCAALYEL